MGVLIRKIEEEVEAGQALARATGEAIKVPTLRDFVRNVTKFAP